MKVHLGWFVVTVTLLCIAMYPCNYLMMKNAEGVYNNDPTHGWYHGRMGPSPVLRSISLVLSPVTVPLNGLYWVAEQTFDPLTQPDPTETEPAPMPEDKLTLEDIQKLHKQAMEKKK